jgi:2'-5' RNA ligase
VVGDAQLRLFLALRLPDHTVDGLTAWGDRWLTSGRRVPSEHLHITLAFLGARPAVELPEIVGALREEAAATPPFELGPGPYRETRSVGMVVLGDLSGHAVELAGRLHDRLEQMGVYRRESRPWLPHVTVLRFRERPGLHPPVPPIDGFAPSDAAAFLSRLHRSGARYDVLEAVPLGSGDNDAGTT